MVKQGGNGGEEGRERKWRREEGKGKGRREGGKRKKGRVTGGEGEREG